MRTKANMADEPSRIDLDGAIFDFRSLCPELSGFLGSEPVAMVLPQAREWAQPAAEWLRLASGPCQEAARVVGS